MFALEKDDHGREKKTRWYFGEEKRRMKAQRRVDNPILTGTGQELLRMSTEVRFAGYKVLSVDDGSWIPMHNLDAAVLSEIEALRGLIRARALRCQVDDCEPLPSGKYVPYLGSENFQRVCNGWVITTPDHGRLEEAVKRIRERYYTEYEPVSYTHLRAHETSLHLVCRLLLEKKI